MNIMTVFHSNLSISVDLEMMIWMVRFHHVDPSSVQGTKEISQRKVGGGEIVLSSSGDIVFSFPFPFSSFTTVSYTMLEATGLSLQLDDGRYLFKNVDIHLNQNDVLVLRGPSGAG